MGRIEAVWWREGEEDILSIGYLKEEDELSLTLVQSVSAINHYHPLVIPKPSIQGRRTIVRVEL